jgi:hypothetical protein
VSKSPSYKAGVRWVAVNDNPADSHESRDVDCISGYISVLLLADLFAKDPLEVAKAVVALREREHI